MYYLVVALLCCIAAQAVAREKTINYLKEAEKLQTQRDRLEQMRLKAEIQEQHYLDRIEYSRELQALREARLIKRMQEAQAKAMLEQAALERKIEPEVFIRHDSRLGRVRSNERVR